MVKLLLLSFAAMLGILVGHQAVYEQAPTVNGRAYMTLAGQSWVPSPLLLVSTFTFIDAQKAELPPRHDLDFGERAGSLPVAGTAGTAGTAGAPGGWQMPQGAIPTGRPVARIDLDSELAAPAGKRAVTHQVVIADGAALKSTYEDARIANRQAVEVPAAAREGGPRQASHATTGNFGGTQWPVLAGILGGMLLLVGLALYLTLALTKTRTSGRTEEAQEQ